MNIYEDFDEDIISSDLRRGEEEGGGRKKTKGEKEENIYERKKNTFIFESFSEKLSKVKIRLNMNFKDDSGFYELNKNYDLNKIADKGKKHIFNHYHYYYHYYFT